MQTEKKLPNLKDIDLFIDIHRRLKTRDLSLNAVARELGRSPSTISECISTLKSHYKIDLVDYEGGIARPTLAADKAVKMFTELIEMVQSLRGSETAQTHEVRVATTVSLRHRLFRGPIAAFMWWLKTYRGSDAHRRVRVVVDAFDHNTVARSVAERGIQAYHWGVCWHLPQFQHSYLDFVDIPFPDADPNYEKVSTEVCATSMLALTSDLAYGGQDPRLVALFGDQPYVAWEDLRELLGTTRVALLHSEPGDDLRQELQRCNSNTAVRVHQYEEALHHVQSTDADLAVCPGWYRYRHFVEKREIELNGWPVTRPVRIILRRPDRDTHAAPHTEWEEPVKACYIIFRMFLSSTEFAPYMFAGPAGKKAKRGGATSQALHDLVFERVTPERIARWVEKQAPVIQRYLHELPGELSQSVSTRRV